MTFSSEGELREEGKEDREHKAPGTPGPNSRDDWHDEGHDGGAGSGVGEGSHFACLVSEIDNALNQIMDYKSKICIFIQSIF
jgi:hypothetical protein